MAQALQSPAIDARSELAGLAPGCRVHLFGQHKRLAIYKQKVTLIQGSSITRNFTFDENVIAATFTHFPSTEAADSEASLVICLARSAHIYTSQRTFVINFPFTLKSAMPFEFGLLLEKEKELPTSESKQPRQLASAQFLSLVDPMGEFRTISSSSTSLISPHEEVIAFPPKLLNKSMCICATFNRRDKTVILYHIRASRNTKRTTSNINKTLKRKHSLFTTPNPTRILEDESLSFEPNLHGIVGPSASLNMEKKRTSTLLSDASSIARMGSEMSIGELKPLEMANFRKDMIFTKIDAFSLNVSRSQLDIFNLYYQEKEAIVVVNKEKGEAKVYIFIAAVTAIPQYQNCYTIKCQHCIPLENSDFEGIIIALKDGKDIFLVNPFVGITSPPFDIHSNMPPLKHLQSSFDNEISVMTTTHKSYIVKLILKPSNEVVGKCLQCFEYLSGSSINETIWTLWRSALMLEESRDDWNAFVITILCIYLPFDLEDNFTNNSITELLPKARHLHALSKIEYSFRDLIPYILLSLHLVREEVRLDTLNHTYLSKLGTFLAQSCVWLGWPEEWSKYYLVTEEKLDQQTRLPAVLVVPTPPNILESLTSLFSDSIKGYLTFSQLVEESFTVDAIIIPRTHAILKLFELLVSPHFGPNSIVDLMGELGISIHDLESFPIGVSLLLKEAIAFCQERPEFEWTQKALELVGRKDLRLFLSSFSYQPPTSLYSNMGSSQNGKDINHSLFRLLDGDDAVIAWDDQSEADRIGITKLIFDSDRRYYEITTLLHQTKTQSATLVVEDNERNDYDVVLLQRELASIVALRTLAIPLGRASLYFDGRMPLLTEKFPIPKFNLNTMIAPSMTKIVLTESTIDKEVIDWGYFHNGAASGLSISRNSKGISGSWIIFNKPPALNSQHAGFLLGLGLNGHLKSLEEWHIYNYLGPKHPLTSVGLLMGMAASNIRSMDIKLTKVLSVHAVALLPQGANDLNVPVVVQAAGLLGIGLLYLESQHRRMSEILLTQITSSVPHNDSEQIHEGYRLAAGIALGFVNLGKGRDLKGLNDTRVVDRLLAIAISMKDYQPVQELDKSCSGAILALGFIHIKTENTVIASKLALPSTEQLLDYIRPDLLLLRCIAKNLIMWSGIGSTREWVESQIPPTLLARYTDLFIDALDSDQISFFNILGGTCLSMAIKFASTHNIKARDTLLHYLDRMMVVAAATPSNYDERITCHSANNIQNLLALSVSVVMAGSGDLETLRRLRILYGGTGSGMNYGNYMAVNMALGFLFVGGGQYAFGDSNLAIACLVVSLYPVFPNGNGEYEVHLQALRHFWSLSLEPRCLIVRDTKTHKPAKVPVTISMRTGEIHEILTPCLLPSLNDILMIQTESLDHFKVQVDFQLNSTHLEIFKRSLTLFVHKRENFQLLKSTIRMLLGNENKALQIDNHEMETDGDIEKVLEFDIMKSLPSHDKQIYFYEMNEEVGFTPRDSGLSICSIIDSQIELNRLSANPHAVDDLWNLKLIFAYTEKLAAEDMHYISIEFIEALKNRLWKLYA